MANACLAMATTMKVKFSTIVDQANDVEIELIGEPEVTKGNEIYWDELADVPRPEEDFLLHYLAGLRTLYRSGQPSYVDLAVWGPSGRR